MAVPEGRNLSGGKSRESLEINIGYREGQNDSTRHVAKWQHKTCSKICDKIHNRIAWAQIALRCNMAEIV